MQEPQERLQALVNDAVETNPDSIDDAIDEVLKKAGKVAWFVNLADKLVRQAIRGLIQDRRHLLNVAMRGKAGQYGGKSNIDSGAMERVGKLVHGYMSYMIAGKTLAKLTGDELLATADSEAEKATGHEFNVLLCRKLAEKVKGDKIVAECFTVKTLAKVFESVRN